MTTVTPLIVPGLAMPAIVVPALVIATVVVPVMMTLPVIGRFLPVTILMLPPLVITMTMPVIVATRATITTTTQYRPSGSADPGTDQLTMQFAQIGCAPNGILQALARLVDAHRPLHGLPLRRSALRRKFVRMDLALKRLPTVIDLCRILDKLPGQPKEGEVIVMHIHRQQPLGMEQFRGLFFPEQAPAVSGAGRRVDDCPIPLAWLPQTGGHSTRLLSKAYF